MRRKIYASQEAAFQAQQSSNKFVKVYSFFPLDRADCECQQMIQNWKMKLAQSVEKDQRRFMAEQEFLVCPRDKTGLTRYKIICNECGMIQGYCWASTPELIDWCDFHYVQWTRGDFWRGCFTPHISPITQQLHLECCCGVDTRDFRANMTINQREAERREAENSIGRAYNQSDSKFLVVPV